MSENKEDRDRHLKAYSFSVLRGVMILLESPPGFQFSSRVDAQLQYYTGGKKQARQPDWPG
jgi:hypothetical protein